MCMYARTDARAHVHARSGALQACARRALTGLAVGTNPSCRYIYMWIKYALFEELQTKDASRTRQAPPEPPRP